MTTHGHEGVAALTEKEKQTLRLIVRGHDAKSIARDLGLSVHTINERLRGARRKMAVSSSRAAARLLLEVEGGDPAHSTPKSFGHTEIGDDANCGPVDYTSAPIGGAGWGSRSTRTIVGVILMILALGLLALTALPQLAADVPSSPSSSAAAQDPEVVDSARQFLVLVDQGRWYDSYQSTGAAFRSLNTAAAWAAASERVRVPLGAVISRTFVSQENLPAPPAGYEVVKFRTRFANKAEALETVTLNREDGGWHVVGVTVG